MKINYVLCEKCSKKDINCPTKAEYPVCYKSKLMLNIENKLETEIKNIDTDTDLNKEIDNIQKADDTEPRNLKRG